MELTELKTLEEKGRSGYKAFHNYTRARHYHVTLNEPGAIRFGPAQDKKTAEKALRSVSEQLEANGHVVLDQDEYYHRVVQSRNKNLPLDPSWRAVSLCPCRNADCHE